MIQQISLYPPPRLCNFQYSADLFCLLLFFSGLVEANPREDIILPINTVRLRLYQLKTLFYVTTVPLSQPKTLTRLSSNIQAATFFSLSQTFLSTAHLLHEVARTGYVVHLTDTSFTFLLIGRSLLPSPPALFFILCYILVKETICPAESHTFWAWWSLPGGVTPPAPGD